MREEYVKKALRTENTNFEEIEYRLSRVQIMRMMHGAMGMVTEAGELMDILKKHIFYGHEIDWKHVHEELGDTQWYQALLVDASNTSLDEVQNINIAKLKVRYPEKFNEGNALNRDLDAEQKVIKGEV